MADDAEPLDELLQDAEAAREEAIEISRGGGRFQIIRFTTGQREFAIPIESVLRTERVPPIIPVPRAPDYIRGIASLRGGVVCIIDLAHLLSDGKTSVDREARSLLILGVGLRRLGVLSETLPDFERIEASETLGIPTSDREIYSGALERGGGLVGIIDPDKLMDHIQERLSHASP